MNKTMLCVIVSLMTMMLFIDSINGDRCACSCCLGNGCKPASQGSFSIPSCDDCSNECRKRYAQCPSEGNPGATIGACASGADAVYQKSNMILATTFLFVCWVFKFNL